MKYSEIKTLDQLDRAHAQIKSKLERKGDQVVSSFYGIKDSYSPSGLLLSGLRSVSAYIPVDQLLLTVVRHARKRLLKK